MNILETIRAFPGETLLDDGAITWTAENLCNALLDAADDNRVDNSDYVVDGYGVYRINHDGYMASMATYTIID